MMSFRNRLASIAGAPWLRRVWLYRVCYAFAVLFDACVDWCVLGFKARYPDTAPDDALPVLGRERGIERGFAEPRASYVARLVAWLSSRRSKGGAYATLDQLAGYLTGYDVPMAAVNLHGDWRIRAADGTRSHVRAASSNWLWDTLTTAWSRYWIVVWVPASLWTPRLWNAFVWGNGTIGSSATRDQIATLRALVAAWNPPHASCVRVVLAFDAASFDPAAAPGAPMPVPAWMNWHALAGGTAIPTRLDTALYLDGSYSA